MVGGKKQTLIPKKVAQISPKILNRIHFAYSSSQAPRPHFPWPLFMALFALLSLVLFLYMNFCGYIQCQGGQKEPKQLAGQKSGKF